MLRKVLCRWQSTAMELTNLCIRMELAREDTTLLDTGPKIGNRILSRWIGSGTRGSSGLIRPGIGKHRYGVEPEFQES